jgi:hypothetical protein
MVPHMKFLLNETFYNCMDLEVIILKTNLNFRKDRLPVLAGQNGSEHDQRKFSKNSQYFILLKSHCRQSVWYMRTKRLAGIKSSR